jgi:DNA helicase-2/ATP-dependent DNA helicase PcrA
VNVLEGLNDEQRKAVRHGDSPLLVFAGAGSGKTRVIVHRIAYLITERSVSPERILAVTFTNKAADEMTERVEKLLSGRPERMWIGTFHSACVRILRRDAGKIGLTSNFTIYDREDSLSLIKTLAGETTSDLAPRELGRYLERISSLKSELKGPRDTAGDGKNDSVFFSELYSGYQEGLAKNNALDFDDLIMKVVELFTAHPDVLRSYQDRFSHILVDEYQDTNYAQYRLVSLLAGRANSLFVVGDDDQSIYGWRGADIRNILEFEKDFPEAASVILDKNYRSTGNILDAASGMISHNDGRKPKKLTTNRERGEKIALYRAHDDRDEAAHVAEVINRAYVEDGFSHGDFAILYRTNAQSRVLEEVLRREGIPYQVVGALSFYRRREIKDILAYLKVMVNPSDSNSLMRIINIPPRGIGRKTIETLRGFADRNGLSLYEALTGEGLEKEGIGGRIEKLRSFRCMLDGLIDLAARENPALVLRELIERVDYTRYLQESVAIEPGNRIENIDELVRSSEEFSLICRQMGRDARLIDFLERASLMEDTDDLPSSVSGVSLLTLHNAKGLEFPFVFITGLEEGVLPWGNDGIDSRDEVEEERRLFYVGMTRAQSRLYLSQARQRMNHGQIVRSVSSRFIREIPAELIDERGSSLHGNMVRTVHPDRYDGFEIGQDIDGAAYDGATTFAVGDTIYHREFGSGVVIDSDGYGESLKLTIEFDAWGRKKIYPRYATLYKEGEVEGGYLG